MATLGELLSGGQKRRQWLDQTIGDLMEYYTPPNLRPAAEFVAQMNPIQGMADSMQQGGIALDPSQTPAARKKAALNSIVEGLIAVAPAAVASRGYMTPAQGTMESLLGWSPAGQQIADDLGRFVVDEAGNIRVPLPKPRNEAEAMARDILELRAAGRASEVTDDMMAKADPQYMFNNTPLDMSQEARMARADEYWPDEALHGTVTSADFSSLDRGAFSNGLRKEVYVAPSTESGAKLVGQFSSGDQGRVFPLRMQGSDYVDTSTLEGRARFNDVISDANLDLDFQMRGGFKPSGLPSWAAQNEMDAMNRSGVDGLRLHERDWVDSYAVFNPNTLRSRFARFDPAFKHLANLSAGTIGALLGLNQIQAQQNPQGGM